MAVNVQNCTKQEDGMEQQNQMQSFKSKKKLSPNSKLNGELNLLLIDDLNTSKDNVLYFSPSFT